jgi:hypothetical protein
LRTAVKTVWIDKGNQLFGGGNNNLLIHTGESDACERDGYFEEGLVHEASRISLDSHGFAIGPVD